MYSIVNVGNITSINFEFYVFFCLPYLVNHTSRTTIKELFSHNVRWFGGFLLGELCNFVYMKFTAKALKVEKDADRIDLTGFVHWVSIEPQNGVADRAAVSDVDFSFRAQPPHRLSVSLCHGSCAGIAFDIAVW